jgi:RecB family endonuclease NucS
MARDRRGNTVLIECKGIGREAGCEQLKRYGDRYARKGTRLILVAFRFDNRCLRSAKSERVELVECDLTFGNR